MHCFVWGTTDTADLIWRRFLREGHADKIGDPERHNLDNSTPLVMILEDIEDLS